MYESIKDNYMYRNICNKFENKFKFIPSVNPAIEEPMLSYTISLTEGESCLNPDEDELIEFFRQSFNKLTGKSKIRYIIDWYHKIWYAPDYFKYGMWVYPDEDYAICLSEDMNSGTFGHPWEQTICIFGKELIKITRTNLPLNFSKVLRENI